MWDGEQKFDNKPQRKLKWVYYTACLEGTGGEIKAGCRQRELQAFGPVPFGLVDGVIWAS